MKNLIGYSKSIHAYTCRSMFHFQSQTQSWKWSEVWGRGWLVTDKILKPAKNWTKVADSEQKSSECCGEWVLILRNFHWESCDMAQTYIELRNLGFFFSISDFSSQVEEKAEEWLWLESEIILIPHPPCLAWLARLLLFVCSVMYLCSDCNQGGCCTNNKGPFYIILGIGSSTGYNYYYYNYYNYIIIVCPAVNIVTCGSRRGQWYEILQPGREDHWPSNLVRKSQELKNKICFMPIQSYCHAAFLGTLRDVLYA